MQEAIKDKTAAVQKEMEDAQNAANYIPQQEAYGEEEDKDSDSDFNDDDDDMFKNIREQRVAALKAK